MDIQEAKLIGLYCFYAIYLLGLCISCFQILALFMRRKTANQGGFLFLIQFSINIFFFFEFIYYVSYVEWKLELEFLDIRSINSMSLLAHICFKHMLLPYNLLGNETLLYA